MWVSRAERGAPKAEITPEDAGRIAEALGGVPIENLFTTDGSK
jgi:hypothetical protein